MPAERTILVVDDDPIQREILSLLLGARNWTVHLAENGEAALEHISRAVSTAPQTVLETAPHTVLCDLRMPGLCGAALAERLRQVLPPETRLLAMTATTPADAEHTHEAEGYDAVLLKPIDLSALEASEAPALDSAGAHAMTPQGSQLSDALPRLDREVLARLAATMPPAALDSLLRMAVEDMAQRVERMRAAAIARDTGTYRREAHTVKGSCGFIGARRLASLAAEQESESLEVSTESALHGISMELAELRLMLEELPAGTDPSTPPPA